jgi:Na+/proline symporter
VKKLSVIGYRLSVETLGRRDRQPRTDNRQLVLIALLVALAIPSIASACPVCFGDPNSPMTKSASNAVWFLLGIVGFVQIGFVALFVTFWRRARAMKKFREQFQVVEGGVH